MSPELMRAYQELADFTNAKCQEVCGKDGWKHACCTGEYCYDAKLHMKYECGLILEHDDTAWDNEDDHVPFMGPYGCLLPPHYRPICTVYACSQIRDNASPEWDQKHRELVAAASQLGWQGARVMDAWRAKRGLPPVGCTPYL